MKAECELVNAYAVQCIVQCIAEPVTLLPTKKKLDSKYLFKTRLQWNKFIDNLTKERVNKPMKIKD